MNGGAGGQSGPGSGLQALDLAGSGIAVLRAGLDPAGLDVGAVHALGDLLDIAGGDLVHNAVQGLPEIIEIATHKAHKDNWKEKHSKDAKYGWYKYTSRFAAGGWGRC